MDDAREVLSPIRPNKSFFFNSFIYLHLLLVRIGDGRGYPRVGFGEGDEDPARRKEPTMKLDVDVVGDRVHIGEDFSLCFQRTLRIPDDGRTYPLPPGLGMFPVRRVDDYLTRVPEDWREHGGVFLPMYQREAMWLSFTAMMPHALKIAVGKVCALTGEKWSEHLQKKPQNYVVAPSQPWLDGICVGGGRIRQFVAMPLGMGYTVEGQVTGEEKFGGIQLKLFAPKPGRFPKPRRFSASDCEESGIQTLAFGGCPPPPPACAAPAPAGFGPPAGRARSSAGPMGLGAGGRMKQKIYPDPHGIDAWDTERTARLYVHIVNSELWREITGEAPPETPVTAKQYAAHGFPWFDLYDESAPTLKGTATLKGVQSVKQLDAEKSTLPLQDDDPVHVGPLKKLWNALAVRDGDW